MAAPVIGARRRRQIECPLKHIESGIGKWHNMGAMVLGPLTRNGPEPSFTIDLLGVNADHLATALEGEQGQVNGQIGARGER